jgi:hypothetical protein
VLKNGLAGAVKLSAGPNPNRGAIQMVEADQSYHPQLSEQSRTQIIRAIIAVALYEARKEIKRNIQREGRIKLCKVPVREIERMAKAMVMERRDEFLAKAKASSVVQDEIRRLQAKEERKRQRRTGHTQRIVRPVARPDRSRPCANPPCSSSPQPPFYEQSCPGGALTPSCGPAST